MYSQTFPANIDKKGPLCLLSLWQTQEMERALDIPDSNSKMNIDYSLRMISNEMLIYSVSTQSKQNVRRIFFMNITNRLK